MYVSKKSVVVIKKISATTTEYMQMTFTSRTIALHTTARVTWKYIYTLLCVMILTCNNYVAEFIIII